MGLSSFVTPLKPECGALFLSEVDGSPPVEVVAVTAEGASVFRFDGERLNLVEETTFNSLFPTWSKEPQFLTKTSQDLDGDGADDMVVFHPGMKEKKPD